MEEFSRKDTGASAARFGFKWNGEAHRSTCLKRRLKEGPLVQWDT